MSENMEELVVNGVKYNSIEEMPDDVRDYYDNFINVNKIEYGVITSEGKKKLVIGGVVYDSADAMPAEIRQQVELVRKYNIQDENGYVLKELDSDFFGDNKINISDGDIGVDRHRDKRQLSLLEKILKSISIVTTIALLVYFYFYL